MDSEIAQLKKEIEQLKEENRVLKIHNEISDRRIEEIRDERNKTVKKWEEMATKLRSRYVPDIEEYQETLVVKIDEDTENYYITFSCSNNPKMKDKKTSKDGKTFYIKNIPSAEFFISHAWNVYKYLYNKGAKKISSKKYSIPKIYCGCTLSEKDFIYEIRSRFEYLKDTFGWHSQYDKIEDRYPQYVKEMKRYSEWNSEKGCLIFTISYNGKDYSYIDSDNEYDESDIDNENDVDDIDMKKRVDNCKFYKDMIEIHTNMKKTD